MPTIDDYKKVRNFAGEFVSHLREGNRKTCSHEVARFLHYTKATFLRTAYKMHSKGVSS